MLTRADALASTGLIERSATALLTAARESPDIGEDHHDVAADARSQFRSAYAKYGMPHLIGGTRAGNQPSNHRACFRLVVGQPGQDLGGAQAVPGRGDRCGWLADRGAE